MMYYYHIYVHVSQVAAQHDMQTFSIMGQEEDTDEMVSLVVRRPSAVRWPRR